MDDSIQDFVTLEGGGMEGDGFREVTILKNGRNSIEGYSNWYSKKSSCMTIGFEL